MDFPWLETLKIGGPAVTIILLFIWRDWQREKSMTRRVERLEKYQRDVLQSLVQDAVTALTQSAECIKWIGRVIERLTRVCPRMIGEDCDKPESLK
jgi:hypothetical protein